MIAKGDQDDDIVSKDTNVDFDGDEIDIGGFKVNRRWQWR